MKYQPLISIYDLETVKKSTNDVNVRKEIEIRIALFLSEHNIPFASSSHLTELIKKSLELAGCDKNISSKISCARTKATKLVVNVAGRHSKDQLINDLQNKKFSLIIDEATDISSTKNLALAVRYFDNKKIKDSFLALIKVADATALNLYNVIVKFFNENNINYKEMMIGFASDGAANMFGIHHSVSQLFLKDIPDLFLMKCICHSFALCANEACKTLDEEVEQSVRRMHSYFKNSYKRTHELKVFQEFVQVKPNKLLHIAATRWLSLNQVVNQVLQQYNALQLFFTHEHGYNYSIEAGEISKKLNDRKIFLTLQFLEFVLPLFTRLNLEMQAEITKIHVLYSRIETTYKNFLNFFLKPEYFESVSLENVDLENQNNFVD